jgi:NTE family protein
LRGVGVGGQGEQARGSALASYLLFEAPYTRELMALGEADTEARESEVMQFFGWDKAKAGRRPEGSAPPDIVLP